MVRSVGWIWPFSVIEVLLVRVNVGAGIFARTVVLRHWYLWAWLGVTLLVHYTLLLDRKPHLQSNKAGFDEEHAGFTLYDKEPSSKGTPCETIDESTPLMDHDTRCDPVKSTSAEDAVFQEPSFWSLLGRDLQRLGLPLELLTATLMLALLRHSIPSVLRIWPACNTVLSTINPYWRLAAVTATTGCTLALLLSLLLARHSNEILLSRRKAAPINILS